MYNTEYCLLYCVFSCQELFSLAAKANLSYTPRSGMTEKPNVILFKASLTMIYVEHWKYRIPDVNLDLSFRDDVKLLAFFFLLFQVKNG